MINYRWASSADACVRMRLCTCAVGQSIHVVQLIFKSYKKSMESAMSKLSPYADNLSDAAEENR